LSHKEISKIFKKVKTFISYDPYTAYSNFAALCGAESVVIPDDNVKIDQWYSDEENRYGLAYGFENINESLKTTHLLLEKIKKQESYNLLQVSEFCNYLMSMES